MAIHTRTIPSRISELTSELQLAAIAWGQKNSDQNYKRMQLAYNELIEIARMLRDARVLRDRL